MLAEMSFTLKDVLTLAGFAFALGKLWSDSKQNARSIRDLDERHTKWISDLQARQAQLEERFLAAVEHMGEKLSEVANELKDLLAQHNTRLTLLENKERLRES